MSSTSICFGPNISKGRDKENSLIGKWITAGFLYKHYFILKHVVFYDHRDMEEALAYSWFIYLIIFQQVFLFKRLPAETQNTDFFSLRNTNSLGWCQLSTTHFHNCSFLVQTCTFWGEQVSWKCVETIKSLNLNKS